MRYEIKKDGRKTIIIPDGAVGYDIRRRAPHTGGCPGWQVFNYNTGYEKYARNIGTFYGDTLAEAVERIKG